MLPGGRCGHDRIKQRGDTASFCHLGPPRHLPPGWFCDDQLPFVPQHAQTCLCICSCSVSFLVPSPPCSWGGHVPKFQLLPSPCGFCAGHSDRVSNSEASGDRHQPTAEAPWAQGSVILLLLLARGAQLLCRGPGTAQQLKRD